MFRIKKREITIVADVNYAVDVETFLNKVNESNESSKNLLKNTMLDTIIDSPQEVMDYAETINSDGAKKINGGGFKGTVVIYVRKDKYNDVYKKLLNRFNDRVIEIEIDKLTCNDKIDFKKYDLIYIGSGSDNNLFIALPTKRDVFSICDLNKTLKDEQQYFKMYNEILKRYRNGK